MTRCPNNSPRSYIVDWDAVPPKITFQPCGNVSYHMADIEHKYCRVCQLFLDDESYDPLTDPELK